MQIPVPTDAKHIRMLLLAFGLGVCFLAAMLVIKKATRESELMARKSVPIPIQSEPPKVVEAKPAEGTPASPGPAAPPGGAFPPFQGKDSTGWKRINLELREARIVYTDHFQTLPTRWPQGKAPDQEWGQWDKAYHIRPLHGGVWGWNGPCRAEGDFASLITGRVTGPPDVYWGVSFGTTQNGKNQCLMVQIFGNGEYSIGPSIFDQALREVMKPLGPVAHPAIKPRGEYSSLEIVMRGRQVEFFVNGEQLREPLAVPFSLTPAGFTLFGGGPNPPPGEQAPHAEFTRFTLWSLDKSGEPLSQSPALKELLPGPFGIRQRS